jgi:hypothetical protein
MTGLKSQLANARARVEEVSRRVGHAHGIFSKRFFTLALRGHVDLEDDFRFDESRQRDRGAQAPNGQYYSKFYSMAPAEMPASIKAKIAEYDPVIRMYLGNDYLINEANAWRNMSIPQEYKGSEIFSQHWHYDRVVDFRNIQLFVLLKDVGPDDGPFEYVANPDEKTLYRSVLERSNADLGVETKTLIGKRGDTLLFSTGSTPHRAGVPAEGRHRDIFSVAFFPGYTKIGIPASAIVGR